MLTVPAKVLFELERELGEPRFMGVPVGATLGNLMHTELYMGKGRWDQAAVWKNRIRLLYHYWKGPVHLHRSRASISQAETNRLLFTLTNNRNHLDELVVPIIEQFEGFSNVLFTDKKVLKKLPGESGVLPINSLSSFFDIRQWRKAIRPYLRIWHKQLYSILTAYQVPTVVGPRLLDAMLVSSQHVVAFHHLIKALSPVGIITDFDRTHLVSPLILAAKSYAIPTMTMIHGVINPPCGYTPLLADVAFCWGEHSRNQMISMGTSADRLVITGYQRLKRESTSDRLATRRKLGVLDDRLVVLFASNPIARQDRKSQVRTFCNAFAAERQVKIVVRLHPVEKLAFYEDEIADFPSVLFTEASFMSSDEALEAADVIVVRSSGFGNDALVRDKTVIVLDGITSPLGNAQILIENAGCPYVQNSDELLLVIKRIMADPQYRLDLRQKSEAFVKYQYESFGDEAIANVVREIQNRTAQKLRTANASD